MSRLSLALAAVLLSLLAAPAVAETIYLKCPADAKSFMGWRLIVDPEAGTVDLYLRPGGRKFEKRYVYWSKDRSSVVIGIYDGIGSFFSLDADLAAITLQVRLSHVGGRRSSTSTFACASVAPFTLKEFDRAEDFKHLPPEERARALASDAAMREVMAEYDRQIALHGRPVPWDAVALFGGLGAGALLLLGAMIRRDLRRRRERNGGA